MVHSTVQYWPGVDEESDVVEDIHFVDGGKRKSKRVTIDVGGTKMRLYCDTGSKLTIIPPKMYRRDMGEVVPARCHLRAWGSSKRLDTKGMFKTTVTATCGATKQTWVYVVGGTNPEPLLGAEDAEDLGIIKFNPTGSVATSLSKVRNCDTDPKVQLSIPEKIRRAGI